MEVVQKYFKQKYLSDRYYDDKIKEFHEMRLGQLTMEEYDNKFLKLLRYVRYIKDEKVKIQRFLSGLPQSYKDRIEFDEPRMLEDAIKKAKYCYDQNKGTHDHHKAWKEKKNEKFEQRRKGFKPSNYKNQQQRKPSQSLNQLARVTTEKTSDPKDFREHIQ